MSKLKKLKQKIKNAKKEALKEILEDDSILSLDKLDLLTEMNLGSIGDWVPDIFEDWKIECNELERLSSIAAGKSPDDYICTITDDHILGDYERHETVYYNELLKMLQENHEDDMSKEILVISNRGDHKSELKKTLKEVLDKVTGYAIANQEIGFVFDW